MPLPTPDPGLSALNAERPCNTRRWALTVDNTVQATYGWFPWKGQNIDTPVGRATKWTTDDDTHPIP